MTTRSLPAAAAGLALALGAGCAHHPPATTGATPAASTAALPCPATVGAGDVAGWRLVSAGKFAFCLPPQWRVSGQSASLGASTLRWGTGEHPRGPGVVVRTERVVSTSGSRTNIPPPPRTSVPVEGHREAEIIGGRRADVWNTQIDRAYHTGAQWAAPHVWITGEGSSPTDAEAQLAIIRTMRFPTP